MSRNLKVKDSWFDLLDNNNRKLSVFLKKVNSFEVFCSACVKSINVKSNGYAAIKNHIERKVHVDKVDLKFNKNPLQTSIGNFLN